MDDRKDVSKAQRHEWDIHWTSLNERRSIFSSLSLAARKFIFQPAVAYYTQRYFRRFGVFLEAGCGTAESSGRIHRNGRTLIGLDFSEVALRAAKKGGGMDAFIRADIFAIPCRSQSIDGIWNLGVMEHFTEAQIRSSLREFRRVLKPGGAMILFWPTEHNSSRWVLGPVEFLINRWRRSNFTFFPGEINRLRSRRQARELLESEGLRIETIEFNWRTAFIHMVVTAKTE